MWRTCRDACGVVRGASRTTHCGRGAAAPGCIILLVLSTFVVTGCLRDFVEGLAIEDYDPVIELPGDSKLRIKTSRDKVKVEYTRRF